MRAGMKPIRTSITLYMMKPDKHVLSRSFIKAGTASANGETVLAQHRRVRLWIFVSAVLLLFLLLASIRYGSVFMEFSVFCHALRGDVGYETQRIILYAVRIPRSIAGLLAGVGLSLSGLLLQTVTDNALAGPNIIGVNAGAGFACVAALSFFPVFAARPAGIALAAFLGAFLTTLLIVLLAVRSMQSRSAVILAGVAVTSILNAAISCLTLLDTDILSAYNAFSVGGFSGIRMEQLSVPAAVIFGSLFLALLIAPRTAVLCIGDSAASLLGIGVRHLRLICILCASASAAAVVSFAGLLGFVGLIVPHMAKKLSGIHGGVSLTVLCVLLGGCVTVAADLIGRILFPPTEIPVGIMMAFIGGPFFIGLLWKRRHG